VSTTSLAGWPFWASVIAHAAGIAVASAAAGTVARPSPPPVPIQLVQGERPAPPPEPPRPRVVRAPRILHQPQTAPASAPLAPASLLDDAPPRNEPAPTADPVAPSRRFLSTAAAAGPKVSSHVPAGSGALFPTGDLPVAAGGGARGGQGGGGTAQSLVATGTGNGLTEFARPLGGYQTTPRYPESARRQGIEGITTLRFVVLPSGRVDQILVARSAGHVDLDRAAVDAVRTWRFEPARRGKEAVAVWVTLPVRFELDNE
jgi:periplasmic protein TonB